ncbi:MAG: hypothetical protein HOO96_13135 [Polyangiaceae bacterium]|nr:hypothetical protein [Polyangiaceae bacterium]
MIASAAFPENVSRFLQAETQKTRRFAIAWAAGAALFFALFLAMALATVAKDTSSSDPTMPFGLAAVCLLVVVAALVVYFRARQPMNTRVARALAQGGNGLLAVYPQQTTVRAAGFSIGAFCEVIFEFERGEPVRWLVPRTDVDATIRSIRTLAPSALPAPPPRF